VDGLLPSLHLGSEFFLYFAKGTDMAFRGTFEYTLDAKNRLTVPPKFRAAFADGAVLAKGDGRYLELWRAEEHEERTAGALTTLHPLSPEREKLERFFFSNSHDTELDAAGRVMVPGPFLDHAGVAKDAVVLGAGKHLEIWDRAAWNEHNAGLAAEVAEIKSRFGHPA
jgi:MraZ protein